VVIARVVKTRGIKGEVACDIETDFPERFEELSRVNVTTAAGNRISAVIEDCWFHKNRVVLKFEGYDSISASAKLVGGLVTAPEMSAEALEEDEFHEHKIVGADVETIGGEKLGVVERIIRTGGTDVLVVRGENGRELMIPFAEEICPEVDPDRRIIKVDPPPGLLEL
jgi:16S rRNA processing protein RimM